MPTFRPVDGGGINGGMTMVVVGNNDVLNESDDILMLREQCCRICSLRLRFLLFRGGFFRGGRLLLLGIQHHVKPDGSDEPSQFVRERTRGKEPVKSIISILLVLSLVLLFEELPVDVQVIEHQEADERVAQHGETRLGDLICAGTSEACRILRG